MENVKRNEKVDPTEIKWRHIRYTEYDKNGNVVISNRGGVTVAYREPTPNTIEYAVAYCNPKENFSRKMGRIISAGRLNSAKFAKTVNLTFGEFHATVNMLV